MFKALLKKQFLEVFSFIFIDKRKGKARSAGEAVLIGLLYVLVYCMVIGSFYVTARGLCEPLVTAGMSWLYFALFAISALFFGIMGSSFSTYNSLYVAKDNEMLFSMPVKPRTVLNSRLVSVYLMSLLYSSLMFIPAIIAYLGMVKPGFLGMVLLILTPVVLAFFVTALSCLLGWLISLIAPRIKSKSIVTVIISLLFAGVYYFFSFRLSSILNSILAAPALIANALKTKVYPLYLLGMGASGDIVKFLLFALICIGSAALVYSIIVSGFSKSVIGGGSASPSRSKALYSEKDIHLGSSSSALFKKELLRFTSSPNYMMNANLGLVFMVGIAVLLFIKGGELRKLLIDADIFGSDMLALIACAAVCMISSMNVTTASSVSLEGKHIWIAHSLPIEPKAALLAKLKLHLALITPPLALLLAAMLTAFRFSAALSVLICIVSVLCVLFLALFGLAVNLKWANLHWMNEVIPIKQSLPTFLAQFSGFGLLLLLFGLYLLLSKLVQPLEYLCIAAGLLAIGCLLLYKLIIGWGSKRFAELD